MKTSPVDEVGSLLIDQVLSFSFSRAAFVPSDLLTIFLVFWLPFWIGLNEVVSLQINIYDIPI